MTYSVQGALALSADEEIRVRVPASSANLGPGFDSFGLAIDIVDTYSIRRHNSDFRVQLTGPDQDSIPTDESNLVAMALIAGLRSFGKSTSLDELLLTCDNKIPHGRGLGSSAAAIVGGVRLAAELAGGRPMAEQLQLAADIEGHPDNVAASLLGGFTIAWSDPDGRCDAITLPPAGDLRVTLLIPTEQSPTDAARALLGQQVARTDATANVARAGLLVAAMTTRPEMLLAGTEDRLHQEQRRSVYPAAMELVDSLRSAGVAAAISGAGPTVLALSSADVDLDGILPATGVTVQPVTVAAGAICDRVSAE